MCIFILYSVEYTVVEKMAKSAIRLKSSVIFVKRCNDIIKTLLNTAHNLWLIINHPHNFRQYFSVSRWPAFSKKILSANDDAKPQPNKVPNSQVICWAALFIVRFIFSSSSLLVLFEWFNGTILVKWQITKIL